MKERSSKPWKTHEQKQVLLDAGVIVMLDAEVTVLLDAEVMILLDAGVLVRAKVFRGESSCPG